MHLNDRCKPSTLSNQTETKQTWSNSFAFQNGKIISTSARIRVVEVRGNWSLLITGTDPPENYPDLENLSEAEQEGMTWLQGDV